MKIVEIKTGKTVECNDSFGSRLIEQGKAVLAKEPAEAPKESEKPKKSQKG